MKIEVELTKICGMQKISVLIEKFIVISAFIEK